jgi:hypothetical protein
MLIHYLKWTYAKSVIHAIRCALLKPGILSQENFTNPSVPITNGGIEKHRNVINPVAFVLKSALWVSRKQEDPSGREKIWNEIGETKINENLTGETNHLFRKSPEEGITK